MSAAKSNVLAGRMRQRIRLQAPILTPDGLGGSTRAWQDVVTVWAEIRAASGDERFGSAQLVAHGAYRITLRHREGITPEMRIVFGTRIFAIRAILEREGKKKTLEILAEEGVGL